MQSRRREFLLGLVAGSTALGPGWLGNRSIAATETTALDAARRQAAHRRRRVIYNNDGDDIWAKGADTVDKFLALRHTPLLTPMSTASSIRPPRASTSLPTKAG